MGDGESVDFVPITDACCFDDDGGYGCWVVVGWSG